MTNTIKVKLNTTETSMDCAIYHNKIYHDETLKGEGRFNDKLGIADEILEKIDETSGSAEEAKRIAQEAKTIANQAEQEATNAENMAESAINTAVNAVNVATQAKEESSEAKTEAQQAVNTSQSAQNIAIDANTKSDRALVESSQANIKSAQAVEIAGTAQEQAIRAETKADQAVATSDRAEQKSEEALAGVQSAIEAAERATEAAEAAEEAVREYDGRIQEAQDNAAEALSKVGAKQDQLTSANAGVGIAITNELGTNIFDKNNALLGYGIGATGIIAPTTQYNCSNYVEVEPNTTYIRLSGETPIGNYYHLYDENKVWIERRSATSTGLMETSANTKYIAVAIDVGISLDTYQIVKGTTPVPYTPYENKTIISNTQTSAEWGNITGDITAQADLQDALDNKTTVIIRSW